MYMDKMTTVFCFVFQSNFASPRWEVGEKFKTVNELIRKPTGNVVEKCYERCFIIRIVN